MSVEFTNNDSPPPAVTSESAWRAMVAPYAKPDDRRALVQLVTTGLPFFLVMAVMLIALSHGYLAASVLFPLGAVLLVRLFMFQHDCGHGSFFRANWANDILGWTLGVLTLTPYKSWSRDHAVHHASMGNLDRRGIGDVTTLTVDEYLALSPLRRFGYRLYRHPLVMFGFGPLWVFFIVNRIPTGNPKREWRIWLSVLGTNLALAAAFAVLLWVSGPAAVLLGLFPVLLFAATIGIWLFYIQHQFENAYWEPKKKWNFYTAALQGASFYDLPRLLHWITGNIGFHHIHHLSSRIPNYRLQECHNSNAGFRAAPRLTLWRSFNCARLALWDSERGHLIPFSKLRMLRTAEQH
jgi:omega-6 fatty acid desaturase (delta-12 desaturase)